MLRKLARWPGSRIALLWIVLVVVQGTCAWYVRVPDESPRNERPTTPLEMESIGAPAEQAPPEMESLGAPAEPDSGPRRTGGIAPILDFVNETVLSPTWITLFALFVAGMAVVLYGPAVALLVVTALWLLARRKYGKLRT